MSSPKPLPNCADRCADRSQLRIGDGQRLNSKLYRTIFAIEWSVGEANVGDEVAPHFELGIFQTVQQARRYKLRVRPGNPKSDFVPFADECERLPIRGAELGGDVVEYIPSGRRNAASA